MSAVFTQPPDAALAYQYAAWDRAMEDMEQRYSRYSGDREQPENRACARPAALPRASLYDAAVDALGAIVDAGDADEELTAIDREQRDAEALFSLRESGYVRHCKNRAGETVEAEAFQKSYEARERLRDDTLDLAFKLESAGRRAFGDKKNPLAFIVCPFTGRFHVLPNVMGRNLFPTVAAAKRARLVAALELLLSSQSHRFDLFLTFSWGKRVTVNRLRKTFKAMHRKISKLNAEDFMREFGARFIFRTSEVGGLIDDAGNQTRDETGAITYHPHSHVLLHLERFLPRPQMAELTRRIKAFWGDAWWGIDGAIEKVREACKYTVKPADFKILSGPELVALDDALARLHLVQPLGELREQIRARRESCLTIKRERRVFTEDGQKISRVIPVVMPDWNARKKNRLADPGKKARDARRKAYKERSAAKALADRFAPYGEDGFKPIQGDLFRKPVEPMVSDESDSTASESGSVRPVIRNRVVARLSPAPYFDRVLTPALLVWNYDRAGLAEIQSLPFVRPALEAVRARVEAARVSVHTSAVTVRSRPEVLPGLTDSSAWPRTKTTELVGVS